MFTVDTTYYVTHCCQCGMPFAMTKDFHERRREDHKLFYCPRGHSQHFTGKTAEQKERDHLKWLLERAERARDANERDRRCAKAKATRAINEKKRIEERMANGACPCCNRHFKNLSRHMKTKHPGVVAKSKRTKAAKKKGTKR
jgi:hypothetical protein